MAENDPEQLLDTEVTATAFRSHPYRHPTIGWLEDLQSMSRDDLYRHYREHYIPNNATLVVVGDVEVDDVLRRVERRFGGIPAAAAPPRVQDGGAASGRGAPGPRRAAGDDGLPEGRVARARGHRCRLLPDAGARCRPDRRQGREPVGQFPGPRGAAQGATLYRPGRARARLVCQRRAAADSAAVPLHAGPDGDRRRRAGSRSNRPFSKRSNACEPTG